MRTRTLMITVLVLLLAVASTAWADQPACTADSAKWSADPDSVGFTGGTTNLYVDMTSPSSLKSANDCPAFPADGVDVYANVTLDSKLCPGGSTDTSCTPPTPSIVINPQHYTALSQTHTYQVQFTGGTEGTYTYHVHANASINPQLDGLGWGYGGGVILTVVVQPPAPPTCNTNGPTVNITKPTNGQKFDFCNAGTTIDIAFGVTGPHDISGVSAFVGVDPVSLAVNGLNTQSVTATGTYSLTAVGAYLLTANAIDVCGNTASAERAFGVAYVISGLGPPLAGGGKNKGGSDAPIKFTPRDCTGALVPFDNTVEVKVLGPPVVNSTQTLLQDSTFGSCSVGCTNGANSTVRYTQETGEYITNFTTLAGANSYTVQIYFDGYLNATFTFSTSK